MANTALQRLKEYDPNCALWRYRCPLQDIQELSRMDSKYSPEFTVGGVPWRIHLQQRIEAQSQKIYLAVHLQCLTQNPAGTYGHFKLTVGNEQPELAKSKNFHCHFKKSGSAWGLHHFILMERVTQPDGGFIHYGQDVNQDYSPGRGQRRMNGVPCVAIDTLIRVVEPDADGTYNLGSLPKPERSVPRQYQNTQQVPSSSAPPPPPNYGGWQGQSSPSNPRTAPPPKASLKYPYEESLCDMSFDLNGRQFKAHRCIVSCRLPKLCTETLAVNAVIPFDAPTDVFERFLQYVYTEDLPEAGVLRPEALLDLYALAMHHEFYALAECCLRYCITSLTPQNILPIVLTRFNPNDEALANLYLRVLVNGYDQLIEEKDFEKLPGALTRRLALVYARKEQLQSITVPRMTKTLALQLESLADSGAYWDHEMELTDGSQLKGHKFVLSSRSQAFAQHFGSGSSAPNFASNDLNFSRRAWDKYLRSLYRGSVESFNDLSAEDVAIAWKMNDVLRGDGQLRAETGPWTNTENAVRLLVYAEKHSISTLRDTAVDFLGVSFNDRVRRDPSVWELIEELPQQALVNLFRTVVEKASP